MRVEGLGFRIQDLGFSQPGLGVGFRVWGLGFSPLLCSDLSKKAMSCRRIALSVGLASGVGLGFRGSVGVASGVGVGSGVSAGVASGVGVGLGGSGFRADGLALGGWGCGCGGLRIVCFVFGGEG